MPKKMDPSTNRVMKRYTSPRLAFHMPPPLMARLVAFVAAADPPTTMTAVAVRAIEDYLDRAEDVKPAARTPAASRRRKTTPAG